MSTHLQGAQFDQELKASSRTYLLSQQVAQLLDPTTNFEKGAPFSHVGEGYELLLDTVSRPWLGMDFYKVSK
jgi:hypothetical protein